MADPFLDRLREAICEPEDVDAEALKAAAAVASTELDAPRSLALVRLAYGREVADDARANVLGRLNSKGELVVARGNEQLLAVLAGEALIVGFARVGFMRGLVPAFAVRCARHLGWRPVHPDIEAQAEAYLSQRSVIVRRPEDAIQIPKASENEPEGSLALLTKNLGLVRNFVYREREITRENQAFAWWLLSERRPASPFALAHELYGLLRYSPEPLGTDEMLKRRLSRPTFDAGNDPPGLVDDALSDLCPNLVSGEVPASEDEHTRVRVLFDQLVLNLHYKAAKT